MLPIYLKTIVKDFGDELGLQREGENENYISLSCNTDKYYQIYLSRINSTEIKLIIRNIPFDKFCLLLEEILNIDYRFSMERTDTKQYEMVIKRQ